jgi:hypothetical protein
LKKDLFQNPKIDLALEYLELLRTTLPWEKYAAFLLLMLDVREKRFFFFLLCHSLSLSLSYIHILKFSRLCVVLFFSNVSGIQQKNSPRGGHFSVAAARWVSATSCWV